jgi:beta-carotene ketolase (CrtW type)
MNPAGPTAPSSIEPAFRWMGLAVALGVMGIWGVSWVALVLLLPSTWVWGWATAPAMAWMTFWYTGLFITAHDAMHGTVVPHARRLNDAIGRVAVGLYAMFPYRVLLQEHRRHHRAPASAGDPDWHDGEHPSPVRWYLNFVRHYIRWPQIVGMALVFNVLVHGVGIAEPRLIVFWVVPSLLSTVQLFVFGTWLPHRESPDGFVDWHRARSNAWPVWLSLVTCFHFGYHWEHHAQPHVPWWLLPKARSTRDGAGTPVFGGSFPATVPFTPSTRESV